MPWEPEGKETTWRWTSESERHSNGISRPQQRKQQL